MKKSVSLFVVLLLVTTLVWAAGGGQQAGGAAQAGWTPSRNVDFIVTTES